MASQLIYCSGPMFSPGDLYDQLNVAATLEEAGYSTYLPQRDGIDLGDLLVKLQDPAIDVATMNQAVLLLRKAIYAMDTYQVTGNSQALVFNMNGRVPDDGSVVELSMAYMAGLPVVIYKDTPITSEGKYDNPMIQGMSGDWIYAGNYSEIVPRLQARIAGNPNAGYTYAPPPELAEQIRIGQQVQEMQPTIDGLAKSDQTGAALLAAVKSLIASLMSLGLG